MRIVIILFFSILVSFQSFARKTLKYDDIYDVVLSGDEDKAYTLLLAYQRQDPNFANTYFQLALIAKDWTKEFNPFTEFQYVKLFIYNTKLYFGLAKLKLKEEKKKNRDLYENAGIIPLGKKLKITDIELYINNQIDSIKIFEKNIVKIINNFNKSSDSYNECVNVFMDINTKYNKIKNIYLDNDEALLQNINNLEMYFDSTRIYFNNYKKAIKEYPIKGYNQEYKLKRIITYRLNGLTNSNFLNNNFFLWDYKTWVNEVKKTKAERIKSNRLDIVSLETLMKNKMKILEKDVFSDSYKPYKLDEKFVYKIEKYDNNSLLVKLFKLNEAKINYLSYFRKRINNPKTFKDFSLNKSSEYCYNLFNKKMYSDSINKEFKESIQANEILKYKKFYMASYNGVQGLKDYSLRQDIFFKARQKDTEELLKDRLYYSSFIVPKDSLAYKTKTVIAKKTFPNFTYSENDTYNICDCKTKGVNKVCISGFYKTKSGKIQGFTGISDEENNIVKLNKSQISDTSKIVNILIDEFSEGFFSIETSIGQGIKNTLIKYNNVGKKVSKKVLPFSKIPRYLKYDDINNSILIAFYGTKLDATSDADNEQIIYNFNFDDEAKNYVVKFNAKAYIFDIMKLNNKLLVFSNFVSYTDIDRNVTNSKAGGLSKETNLLITVVTNGVVEKHEPFFNKKPFFGIKAIKINSNLINVLGFKSTFENKKYSNLKNKDLFNLFIDGNLQEVNSTWHD